MIKHKIIKFLVHEITRMIGISIGIFAGMFLISLWKWEVTFIEIDDFRKVFILSYIILIICDSYKRKRKK